MKKNCRVHFKLNYSYILMIHESVDIPHNHILIKDKNKKKNDAVKRQ